MVKKPNFSASSYSKRRSFSSTKKKIDINNLMIAEAIAQPAIINQSVGWKAFHLDEMPCELHVPPNPKVKNCRNNPYCISRLGLEKFEKIKNQQQESSTCSNLERRDLDLQPCGLVNYGNFCYVNSFLQIWYNDLVFRQCIYDWRSCPEFVKPEGVKMDVQAVMDCMQKLFVTMQFTPFETTNAEELIKLLKLDNEQHDVQEFNTLFFDALERNLKEHPNGEPVRELIRNRFESRIQQTISCDFCGARNVTQSEYRSLQIIIDKFKTLTSAIQGFFGVERKKGQAKRASNFSQLPRVLNIQLNRYVFDSGRHRKLKTPIQYPRTIPERALQPNSLSTRSYELCAVMIHEGQNTHCGHYFDLIKDPVNGQWFTYNDKNVAQTKPPGVSTEKETINRMTNDMKGCYALIYQRSDANEGVSFDSLRLPLLSVVSPIQKKLNADFLIETKEGNRSLNYWNNEVNRRHEFLNQMWNDLEIRNGKEMRKRQSDLVFLPTALLSDILLKEFKSIEEMKSLEQLSGPKNNHHQGNEEGNGVLENGDKSPSKLMNGDLSHDSNQMDLGESTDDTAYHYLSEDDAHVYVREPLEDARMHLCCHDKVCYETVFKGDVKAVNRVAAEKLLQHFGVGVAVVPAESNSEGVSSIQSNDAYFRRLRTGLDICTDCVKMVKKEACFKSDLDKCNDVIKNIKQRTHDPHRDMCAPEYPPPEGAVWVSEKHLRSYKKMALEQLEYLKKKGNKTLKDLLFSISVEGFYRTVRSSARHNSVSNSLSNSVLPSLSPRPGPSSTAMEVDGASYDSDVGDADPDSPSGSQRSANRKRKLLEMSNSEPSNLTNHYATDADMPLSPVSELHNGEMRMNGNGTTNALDETDDCVFVEQVSGPVRFNFDLLCIHGNLTFAVKRVWVRPEEWEMLKANITDFCEAIPCSTNECKQCVESYYNEQIEHAKHSSLLEAIQNDILKSMRLIERRKSWETDQLGIIYDRVLCAEFVHKICKPPRTKVNVEIPKVCQDCLLCEHKLPFKMLHNDEENDRCASGVPVTFGEWSQLLEVYARHCGSAHQRPTEIKLLPNGKYENFCRECNRDYNEAQNNKRYVYPEGGDIYVRLVGQGDGSDEQESRAGSSSKSMTTRRLASKNLWKFKMTSDSSVRDLKLKIYEQINQTPADQLIYNYISEKILEDDQTLESAKVEPNNVNTPLTLIVQQAVETSGEPRQLEKGFRDTALSI